MDLIGCRVGLSKWLRPDTVTLDCISPQFGERRYKPVDDHAGNFQIKVRKVCYTFKYFTSVSLFVRLLLRAQDLVSFEQEVLTSSQYAIDSSWWNMPVESAGE